MPATLQPSPSLYTFGSMSLGCDLDRVRQDIAVARSAATAASAARTWTSAPPAAPVLRMAAAHKSSGRARLTPTAKARAIGDLLDRLCPAPPIPLAHRDAFTLLVAVVLSAQCTDAVVNTVTPGLFALADTPARMAALGEDSIRTAIARCGLAPTKARNLRALAEQLVRRHDGDVPCSFEALEALPGVGHKTASVVMAQAFDIPAFPVDTHIHRLAWRWGLSSGRSVKHTEADLKRLYPESTWNRLHLQIIHYGRAYCPARGHSLERCEICRLYGVRSRLASGSAPA